MSSINTLSDNQKTQLRNAFTLIDGESRDSLITADDLVNIHQQLGIAAPLKDVIRDMFTINGEYNEKGLNFTQFLQIMSRQLLKFDDRATIYNALRAFVDDSNGSTEDLMVDVDKLKDACCSVQLGELGSGDHRLERAVFDELVDGFVKQQIDGKNLFQASRWIDAYID
jgi:Ca2+-binding EF-hand superfamily protein